LEHYSEPNGKISQIDCREQLKFSLPELLGSDQMENSFTSTLIRRLQFLGRHRVTIVYSILLVICIVPIIPISIYFCGRIFPWWVDGGNWLKQVNAIFGIEFPMWDEKPLRFDQLYFISLALLIILLKDGLLALKISALIVFVVRPATTFLLAKRIFRSDATGLAAALLSGTSPLFYETIGWGGYPNLLGYAILPITFYFILGTVEKAPRRNVILTGLFVTITVFSHNLTAIVFLGILGLWLVLVLISKAFPNVSSLRIKPNFAAIFFSIVVLLSVLSFISLSTGGPQYNFFNEAAFYKRRVSFDDLVWVLRNPVSGALLILLSAISFVVLRVTRGKDAEPYILAMASWILAPILMTQTYLLGVAIDYKRVFFYAVQPTLIMAMGPLALIGQLFKNMKTVIPPFSFPKIARAATGVLPAALLIVLSLSSLVLEVNTGLSHVGVVNDYYSNQDPYGDKEKLEALDWIRNRTPSDAVFVAEEHFARWTEGYASRRVLMYTPVEYLFFEGEIERSIAAKTLLESRLELRSDLVRISEQEPYGNFTPSISFKREGVYEDTVYINNVDSRVYLTNGTHVWFERLSDSPEARSYKMWRNSTSASYTITYSSDSLSIVKQVVLGNYAEASLTYSIRTNRSSVMPLNLTIPVFSAEGKRFDDVYAESVDQIHVKQGPLSFHVLMNGNIQSAVSSNYQGKDAIIISFDTQSAALDKLTAAITIKADLNSKGPNTIVAVDRDDIIREFNISYVVIPRNSTVQAGGVIPLKLLSLPPYNHLIDDPALTVVFENSRVIILQVIHYHQIPVQ
jgi:hypothetical protein